MPATNGNEKSRPARMSDGKAHQEEAKVSVERLDKPESTAVMLLTGFLQRREANEIMRSVSSLQDEGVSRVIFDLSNVKYANSSAIGAFVNAASSLKGGKGRAILQAMRPNIKRVFETLGLLGLFELASTREEAIEALS